MPVDDLQTLIIDCVNVCLKHHKPSAPTVEIQEPDPGQLLTTKESARLLGVSPSTIGNHARAGNLTRLYIGKSVRFSREQVTSLAQGKTPRTPGQPLLKRAKRKG